MMVHIIAGIIIAIIAGDILVKLIKVTKPWVMDQVKKRMSNSNMSTVALLDIQCLLDNCDNKISLDELEGYSHVMVSVDSENNTITDTELIQDQNVVPDSELNELLGERKMIIVER